MIVGATGHRPHKLGGYSPAVAHRLEHLAHDWLVCMEPERIVSGMALGWDQAVARAAVRLGVPFDALVPFPGQENRWPEPSRREYAALLAQAASVTTITSSYTPFALFVRNDAIVTRSDLLLALWDGSDDSGTADTIRKAHKYGWRKPVVNLWEQWVKI